MEKGSGLKGLAQGRSDIYRIDPRDIHVKAGWNGRDFNDPENEAHIEMLANSIAQCGVKEPLTVFWEKEGRKAEGKAILINGECRLRATLLAISRGNEIKTIPVMTEDRHVNEADRLFSQVVRNSGKPFSPMEQAKVFKRLLDLGWQQSDIALKSGVSGSRVSQVLGLLSMPEPIKKLVSSGQVSASLAQKTIAEHNPQTAVHVLQDAAVMARAEGKKRVAPKHINGNDLQVVEGVPYSPDEGENDNSDETPIQDHKKRHRSLDVEKTVFEAFEHAIVQEGMNEKGESVYRVEFPAKYFEPIRKCLKL
jgi:ParB/RepB/Spo0J family partition protein